MAVGEKPAGGGVETGAQGCWGREQLVSSLQQGQERVKVVVGVVSSIGAEAAELEDRRWVQGIL